MQIYHIYQLYAALINWVVIIVSKEIGNLVRTDKSTFFIKWYRQWTVTCSNLQIYGILSGNGKAIIDGEEISLSTGDWLKIAPTAKRQFFASDISGITYICIQVKENSLEHFTAEDAVIG